MKYSGPFIEYLIAREDGYANKPEDTDPLILVSRQRLSGATLVLNPQQPPNRLLAGVKSKQRRSIASSVGLSSSAQAQRD